MADSTQADAARKSEQEARPESERWYAALVEAVPQIVWTSQPTGEVDFANRRWYDFTGFTPEQTMGSGWTAAVHPDDLEETLRRWAHALQTGEPVEVTYRIRNVEGQYRWHLTRGVPIKDGERVLKWFGTLTDIEDQQQADLLLREEDRRKDEFLATLSHELRNPLAPICNMLEVLKQGSDHSALTQKAIAVMDRQLRQMTRLIDDLLDVSRIRQGRFVLHLRQIELAAVVSQAVETCRPLAESMNHQLAIRLPTHPVYLNGDLARLAQVFGNLLNNACKYTPPGGSISLAAEQQQDTVVVSVRDNGRGIPTEMLSRVFQMFTQAHDSRDEAQAGLGIGLTLVRRFVELHGGAVEARSEGPNRGSEFVVVLPILLDPIDPAESPPKQPPKLRARLRILVVDDNRDAAVSFVALLEMFGHEARLALDGSAAIEIAQDWKPHLLFCDLAMPGMQGTEVAVQLRQRLGDKTMLVALTGYGSEADRRRTTAAGFDHHLVKPIESKALNEILELAETNQVAKSA